LKEILLRCLALLKASQLGVFLCPTQKLRALQQKPEKRRRKGLVHGPLKIRIPKMRVRCTEYRKKLLIQMAVQVLTGVKVFLSLLNLLYWHSLRGPKVPYNSKHQLKSSKNIHFYSGHLLKVIHSCTLNKQINLIMIK
jgi:hypothetical protein